MLGHWPLPAKITVEALEPIDAAQALRRSPDLDEVYDELTGEMQAKLDELMAERSLPVIG